MIYNLRAIALFWVLFSAGGCLDDSRIIAPDLDPLPARPVNGVQASSDGVIWATINLPFDVPAPGQWNLWGRFPEHEELRIPAGTHEVEFTVSGGAWFSKKPGSELTEVGYLDGIYIGSGGIRIDPDEWFPALRLQMGFVHAEYEGSNYPPLYAWQAEPYSTGPAHGRVVVRGPGRIVFNRHYNSGWWNILSTWVTYPGGQLWQYYDYFSDQKVELTIRPLAQLKLSCTGDIGENRVTRGQELVCTAKADAESDQVQIETWSFSGTDSQGRPYSYPEEMDGPVTENPWRGKMAISGTITVRARVNGGERLEQSAPASVEARGWETNLPLSYSVSKVRFEDFPINRRPPEYPRRVRDLGRTDFGWQPLEFTSDIAEQITDRGPNNYLTFLKRVPARANIQVLVHPELETRGDFWRQQPTSQPAYSEHSPCVQGQFDRYVQLVLAHEGDPPSPRSHSGVYLAEFTRRAGPALEALVYPVEARSQMTTKADELLTIASDSAYVAAKDPVDDDYPIPFGCQFDFTPRRER